MGAPTPNELHRPDNITMYHDNNPIMCCNYFPLPQAVVILHDSEDYRFVVVEEFGIVSSYAPRTIRGTVQTMVYVSTTTAPTGHFYINTVPLV